MISKIKDSVLLDILFLLCQITFVIAMCTGTMFLMYQLIKVIKYIVS